MTFNTSRVASISTSILEVMVTDSFHLSSAGIVLPQYWQMGGPGNYFTTPVLLKKKVSVSSGLSSGLTVMSISVSTARSFCTPWMTMTHGAGAQPRAISPIIVKLFFRM